MIISMVVLCWIVLASVPSQLALVAVGILIRLAYMDFLLPKLPHNFILFWVFICVVAYVIVPDSTADYAIMLFMKISLSGVLIMHMMARMPRSPMVRLPYLRPLALFVGRASTLLPKKTDEMKVWARQKIRWYETGQRRRSWVMRYPAVVTFKLATYSGLGTSLILQSASLVERQSAVLEARGQFPSENFLPAGVRGPTGTWLGAAIGDVLLCLLLAAPVVGNDFALVPTPILTFVGMLRATFVS